MSSSDLYHMLLWIPNTSTAISLVLWHTQLTRATTTKQAHIAVKLTMHRAKTRPTAMLTVTGKGTPNRAITLRESLSPLEPFLVKHVGEAKCSH